MSSKKKSRRFLKRVSARKGCEYSEAVKKHYKVSSLARLDKNLVYSLYKKQ